MLRQKKIKVYFRYKFYVNQNSKKYIIRVKKEGVSKLNNPVYVIQRNENANDQKPKPYYVTRHVISCAVLLRYYRAQSAVLYTLHIYRIETNVHEYITWPVYLVYISVLPTLQYSCILKLIVLRYTAVGTYTFTYYTRLYYIVYK